MSPHALLVAGFRPFFLAAAMFAATSVPVWVLAFSGIISLGGGIQASWHAHELIFGYLLAVLSGFLTIRLSGWPLLVLVAIWLAGRAAMALQPGYSFIVAAIDLSFVPALIALRRPALWAVPKWPNGLFLPLLAGLWGVDLAYHVGAAPLPPAPVLHSVSVDLAALLLVVIAGRLVPGYTGATLTHIRPPRASAVEAVSVLLLVVAAIFHLAAHATAAGLCLIGVAGLQGWRMLAWRSWETRGHSLLWILHLGYGWLVVGLGLRGLADLAPGLLSASAALHAITVGAIGSLTLGMMTRITLIHTRSSVTPDSLTVGAFMLVQIAAILRVVSPVLVDEPTRWIVLAAIAWSLAFVLWLFRYSRLLFA